MQYDENGVHLHYGNQKPNWNLAAVSLTGTV